MRLTKKQLIDIILGPEDPVRVGPEEPVSPVKSVKESVFLTNKEMKTTSLTELDYSETDEQIAKHIKNISFIDAEKDYQKLCNLPQTLKNSLVGNKLNWYYFNQLTLYTKVKNNNHNFYEFWRCYKAGNVLTLITQKKLDTLLRLIQTPEYTKSRHTECARFYAFYKNYIGGYIGIFKSSLARNFYINYSSKVIIDPYAGWGGRLIGASSLGLTYTGFDTNTGLKPAYDKMIDEMKMKQVHINFQDSSTVDYSKYTYDTVLTSPPYYVEWYENFDKKKNADDWFTNMMMVTFKNLWKNLKKGGVMGINCNTKMYDKYLLPEFGEYHESIDIKNSTLKRDMKKDEGKTNSKELIYVWIK
jgi:hypothetical protein